MVWSLMICNSLQLGNTATQCADSSIAQALASTAAHACSTQALHMQLDSASGPHDPWLAGAHLAYDTQHARDARLLLPLQYPSQVVRPRAPSLLPVLHLTEAHQAAAARQLPVPPAAGY